MSHLRPTRRATALLSGLALSLGTLLPLSLGSAANAASVDGHPAELLQWQGEVSSATGAALAQGPCDVNGDGYDDTTVGAWFWDKAPTSNIGATYVLLGSAQVHGAELSDPAAAGAVRIDAPGVASSEFTGFAVGCLGDVNGDGYDDLGISHYTAQKIYVVLGAKDFTPVNLGALGDRGYVVKGDPENGGNVGYSLAPVGDVNGDHRADFAVAEVGADTQGRTTNGRIWIVAGQDDIADIDLTAPAPGQVLTAIDGATSGERLGSAASVGDVNGDGLDDILVGSYTATPWGSSVAVPGAAYVVWGGAPAEVDLAALGSHGFQIDGPLRQRDRLGISVSGLGDLNGDGKADLLIGADGVNNATTGPRNGGAAVVFGSSSTATVYTDPTSATGVYTCATAPAAGSATCPAPADVQPRGYWIDGAANADSTGYSVSGLDDINGDGLHDLLIGAYGYDPVNPADTSKTLSGAGAAYVVYGKADTANQALGSLSPTAGYRLDGTAAGDRFGRQVAGLGDVDGNGTADFAIGADFANRGGAQAGEVTVALTGDLRSTTALAISDESVLPHAATTLTATVARPAGSATTPTGSVAFLADGTAIAGCEAAPLAEGVATCEYTPATAGGKTLTAAYSGADRVTASTSAARTLAVTAFGSHLALDTIAPATYGAAWRLAATVTGEGTAPTGTVTFQVGGRTVATVPVKDGRATATVPRTATTPGTRAVKALYSGDTTTAASSATASVSVRKAASATTARLRKARVKRSQHAVLTLQVRAGVPLSGTVTVRVRGGRVLATKKVGTRASTVKLPKLGKGRRVLLVRYAGSATVDASSTQVKLVVR